MRVQWLQNICSSTNYGYIYYINLYEPVTRAINLSVFRGFSLHKLSLDCGRFSSLEWKSYFMFALGHLFFLQVRACFGK